MKVGDFQKTRAEEEDDQVPYIPNVLNRQEWCKSRPDLDFVTLALALEQWFLGS